MVKNFVTRSQYLTLLFLFSLVLSENKNNEAKTHIQKASDELLVLR